MKYYIKSKSTGEWYRWNNHGMIEWTEFIALAYPFYSAVGATICAFDMGLPNGSFCIMGVETVGGQNVETPVAG